jgi:hypothetical protein
MREACSLVWSALVLLFRSRASLEAEILILCHQLNIQRRHLPNRLAFSAHGSPDLCWAVSFGAEYPQGADACEAGDCRPLASCRVQVALAPEVTTAFRPTAGSGRNTAADPTAEWIANQLTEACGWDQIPHYLVRDRDGAYGEIFIRRVDPSAFETTRRRRAPHGKMRMQNG